jgi:phosphomannomutase
MALMKSISGIRGTIGGLPDTGLTPIDIVQYTIAYARIITEESQGNKPKVVVGRDGRISGPMVHQLVTGALQGAGIDVIDLGLSTTPTVEMAVPYYKANGGIILTASHNPREWNALKLLNSKGEFISAAQGQYLLQLASDTQYSFPDIDNIGSYTIAKDAEAYHLQAILQHPLVNVAAIKSAQFNIVLDAINSTGATYVPNLLNALGVHHITVLNAEVTGNFAHNPEPLPQHLVELSQTVISKKAHVGIAVDPDVDRLCFVNEDGTLFGEEYTLVAVADYILQHKPGNTVSNLSSTRALADVTHKHGGKYYASAVGEVNVVTTMKQVNAVIGGEGNGGIIVPEMHYGRDALIGIALFLSHLATSKLKCSELKATYPLYFMSKNKIELTTDMDIASLLHKMAQHYAQYNVNTIDGVKVDWPDKWVHLRPSNTEPIIRIYTEAPSQQAADELALNTIKDIQSYL